MDNSETLVKRTIPHSPEAEESVVGSMLLDREAIDVAAEYLTGEDFYNRQLGIIFDAIVRLYKSGREADPVTLQEALVSSNLPPEFTSASYLGDLVTRVPTSAHVKNYAQIVQDNATKRRLIRVCEDMAAACYAGGKDLAALLGDAEKGIFDVTQRGASGEIASTRDLVIETINGIAKAGKQKGHVTGVATGFTDLDYMSAGFQKSDLILIAARPSMGKSALALNIASYMALHDNHSVVVFSLEMSKGQLVKRLLAMESKVDSKKISTGDLTDGEWERVIMGADALGGSGIIFDDTPSISLTELRSICRRIKIERGLDAIFIDYLQLMTARRGRASESRQLEISEISRGLKAIARELDVPVIALSQLSRAVESRPDKRPMLSDLRESGAIEQDADIVMFLYRDDYYHKDSDRKGITEILIAKHRNGPTGTVELLWMPEHQKFASIERRFQPRS